MEEVKIHPQVSTNRNKIKCLMKVSTYIETVEFAKIIKMGSLHASQKWSLT
jgi:hypothetical protein